jgi:PiT family inorganic phosphate transporter
LNITWALVLLALAYLFTFFTGFNGGNVLATLLASHAMKQRSALLLAALVQLVSPLMLGMAVAKTMGSDIIHPNYFLEAPPHQAWSFLCAGFVACIIFIFVSWKTGIPISASHSLIGGLLGAGVAAFGFAAGNWEKIAVKVILAMILSPLASFVIGFIFMKIVRFFAARATQKADSVITWMQRGNMVLLAAFQASNEAQKSVGVIFLVIMIAAPSLQSIPGLTVYATLSSALVLSAGLMLGGLRIARTVGFGIYRIRPVHSLASQLASSLVLVTSTLMGSPVSPSQIVSSSIVGVGTAFRPSAVRWDVALRIVSTWFTTLPISALGGAGLYYLLSWVVSFLM